MPTYEYGCDACGNEWELEQRISADPVKKCPKCGKLKARRMISGGNFILKGSGWYADLYSKPPSSGGKDKSSEAKSSEAKSSEAKSETKAETKSETKSEASKPAKKAANE